MMKIGILTYDLRSHSHKRLVEAGLKRGHQMSMINLSYCYMNVSSTAPEVYYRSNETFSDLSAIIPRIKSSQTFYGTAVLRQFEMIGIHTLNSALAMTWARDKLRTFQILARKHLPLPITGFAESPEESEKLIDVVGGAPLIVRLLEGIEGKGTVFAETHQAAISVINAFKQLKTNILVQEYIQEAMGKDIRCVVVGNKVVAAFERQDTHEQIEMNPVKISATEKKLAISTAKALKLNFASVDLIRSNRGPLILDVDVYPNIALIENVTGVDVAEAILQFLEEGRRGQG